MSKLFLLDAYALIYRAYYALMRSPRFTTTGMNTSAIFGFCNTLDDVINKEQPDYLAVCFDPPGGDTFRHAVYPEYKAQREKQPEDITLAIPYIKQILAARNIPVIEKEHYEADDVIGTLATQAAEQGLTTYMMTPDKDYGQLVTDNILMYRPALKGVGFEIRGPQQVCERYGIQSPRQVIDLLALEGDASDNVPGCKGVGEKTATKLIQQYGSVEAMIDDAENIPGALGKKIREGAEQIIFSKFLVTIKTDVPVSLDLEAMRLTEPDVEALAEIYRKLEFRTLLAKLKVSSGNVATPTSTSGTPSQLSLFGDEVATEAPATETAADNTVSSLSLDKITTTTPVDIADIQAAVRRALEHDTVGIYVHTDNETDDMRAALMGVAFTTTSLDNADVHAAYVAVPSLLGAPDPDVTAALAPLFAARDGYTIVTADIKHAMVCLRNYGIDVSARYYDVTLAHYLLDPEGRNNIEVMANTLAAYQTRLYNLTDSERAKALRGASDSTAAICCEQAVIAALLRPVLDSRIAADGLTDLLRDIEMPFAAVLASMEEEGVDINTRELARLSDTLRARLDALEQEAYALVGRQFNIGSPTQVGEILFGQLALDPNAKRTKSGAYSTTEEVLEKLRPAHPIVDIILKVRALRKLLTTYIEALPRLINPHTGRIHTTYNQTATATGRISSTNPNLQNIPVRTDDGRDIRRAFVPRPGCVMLSADYSQIELRLIADMSHDSDMVEAFLSGADIHRATAAKIYHVAPDDVTSDQRRNAKTANFGIIYGITAFGLSQRLGIPRAEAKMLIDGYRDTFPGVHRYIEQAVEQARRDGYVTTHYGRRRLLPLINSRNATLRGFAERNAVNAPLQGTAADIIKIAMIRIDRYIRTHHLRSRMILQVHDELVFNVYPDELDQLRDAVVRLMQEAYDGQVPLIVEAGVGDNWLEAH